MKFMMAESIVHMYDTPYAHDKPEKQQPKFRVSGSGRLVVVARQSCYLGQSSNTAVC